MKEVKLKFRAIIFVLIAGVLITILKFLAFFITHSNAIFTDALENIINIVAGAFAFYSIYLASIPRDKNHPYGHGKIEFFAVGFEGSLILIAGVTIIYRAVFSFLHPFEISNLLNGIWMTAFAGISNFFLGLYLIKKSKLLNSIILEADGKHLISDAITSAGLILGLFLIHVTGFSILDSFLSIILGAFILYNGYKLLRTSISGLMDETDTNMVAQILLIFRKERRDVWVDIHNFRVQKYGSDLHIDCHLTLPYYWNLNQMHDEVSYIEKVISKEMSSRAEVFIHVDPCLPTCCFYCRFEACSERSKPKSIEIDWTTENIMNNEKHFVKYDVQI